jgi:predicted O-methyltransferase YrrM
MKIKDIARKAFFRSALARRLMGEISILLGHSPRIKVSHLSAYKEDGSAIGPLQQSEALFLFALVKVTVPKTVLEFGFLHGLSAYNFLRALPEDAQLFSYDIDRHAEEIASRQFPNDRRFTFLQKSQSEFSHSDIGGKPVDLVFLDASHDLATNQRTFEAIQIALSEDSIVCVHDTGAWQRQFFTSAQHEFVKQAGPEYWLNESLYLHRRDERVFLNWILETYPHFQAVHLHSTRTLRHGMSILQRKGRLEIGTAATKQGAQ